MIQLNRIALRTAKLTQLSFGRSECNRLIIKFSPFYVQWDYHRLVAILSVIGLR